MDSNGFALTKSSAQIEGFRSKKELERIVARKVPSWYALGCDCGDNKARDRSARLDMNGFTVVVRHFYLGIERPVELLSPGRDGFSMCLVRTTHFLSHTRRSPHGSRTAPGVVQWSRSRVFF
jgi:hypothetical protein